MNMTLVAVLAGFMIAVGAGFIYFVLRGNERPLPKGGLQWVATVLSALLILFSAQLLAMALVPVTPPPGADPLPSEMDRPAPDFTFRTVDDGQEHRLEEYAGKVVLLNFWATWCAPCIEEMPELNRLQQNYQNDGLVVVTISDEAPRELLAFEEYVPLETTAGYIPSPDVLPAPFGRTMAVRPTSYVVDRDGYLREFVKGAGTYRFFEQLIQPYL